MKYLRKYTEEVHFDDKNYNIDIIGLPSGEVLRGSYENLGDLFAMEVVNYTTYPNTTGFYAFDDKNREKVLDIIQPDRNNALKDILVKDNQFKKEMLDKLFYLINDYKYDIEITVEDYSLMVAYKNVLLDILYNDETSPKYLLIKRIDGSVSTKYSIPNDELLIRSIIKEINR